MNGSMDWTLSPANLRARYFADNYTLPDNIDDDLHSDSASEYPPLLNRRQAAKFLGIGMTRLSSISGNGRDGGRLRKHKVRGIVQWRIEDLQAYAAKRELERLEKDLRRGKDGRYLGTAT